MLSEAELTRQALAEFVRKTRFQLQERFQSEDIEWAFGVEEVPRLIVCDTGPVLHLHQAHLSDLLRLAGRVVIPPAVRSEIRSVDPIPDWVEIRSLDASFADEASAWIQAGLLDTGLSQMTQRHV